MVGNGFRERDGSGSKRDDDCFATERARRLGRGLVTAERGGSRGRTTPALERIAVRGNDRVVGRATTRRFRRDALADNRKLIQP